MQQAGIPVVPGSGGNLLSLDEARAAAQRIGYPLMLKTTWGGNYDTGTQAYRSVT